MDSSVRSTQQATLQEFLMQGSILENHRELLLNRLKGLCDMSENIPEKFHDHEMVYSLRGPPPIMPITLKVRYAIDSPDDPWHIRYVGQADTGDKARHAVIRSFIDAGASSNICQFLSEMGFMLDYEFVVKGYIFRKGRLKVTVSKLNKLINPGNVDMVEPVTNLYLVELSVVSMHGQEQIQEDMKTFAEQLKPLVVLEKIDIRKLQQNL